MNQLYNQLAKVYDAMYQSFIDYDEEYEYYSRILRQYSIKDTVEIGCGTGFLAKRFISNHYEYVGLDLSQEMLDIAKNRNPEAQFIKADMRDFDLPKPYSSMLITARTISYLISNEDVISTFNSIYDNLSKDGILVFDFIDASSFIPSMQGGVYFEHTASLEDTEYVRKSYWRPELRHGMDFYWESTYFIKSENKLIELGQEVSVVRSFTLSELEIFLNLSNFTIIKTTERASYAFPTIVIIAQKRK